MSERNVKENKIETGELAEKFAVVMSEFAPISIYLVISPLVSLILLGLPFPFASNSSTYPEKLSAYECGFDPFGDARSRFDIRFYLVSILFIIPDLEVTFFFPWAVSHNKMGLFGFWSMMAFLLILTIGSFYEWKRSAWAWKSSVKSTLCMIRVTFLTYLFHILISLIFFKILGVPVIAFCDDQGDEQSSSDGESDAGIGAQESSGARPQGEGASNLEAGPPSTQPPFDVPAPDEAAPPVDPQALEDENLRLRHENAELRRLLTEEMARVKGILAETEDQIERSREQDRIRDQERARERAGLLAAHSELQNRSSILQVEKDRLKFRINELQFRKDQQKFRRE